jgi:hypothetical protein
MSKDMFQNMLSDVTLNWDHYIITANGPSYNTIKQVPYNDSQDKILQEGFTTRHGHVTWN